MLAVWLYWCFSCVLLYSRHPFSQLHPPVKRSDHRLLSLHSGPGRTVQGEGPPLGGPSLGGPPQGGVRHESGCHMRRSTRIWFSFCIHRSRSSLVSALSQFLSGPMGGRVTASTTRKDHHHSGAGAQLAVL